MKTPDEGTLKSLLLMPWMVETGTLEDGTRFARCVEIPHAVAYAEGNEEIGPLFWDALRASLHALLSIGERVPMPKAFGGIEPQRQRDVAAIADPSGHVSTIAHDRGSWGLSQDVEFAQLQPA